MPGLVGLNGLGLVVGLVGAGGAVGLVGGSIVGAGASANTSLISFTKLLFKFLSISV
jgi:hypothetical protein